MNKHASRFGVSSSGCRGVSLISVLIAVVIIGIMGALAYPKLAGAKSYASENAKQANVVRMNELVLSAINLGAVVGAGAANDIDTTNAGTAINSLNAGFIINSVHIKLEPPIANAGSYQFNGSPTAQLLVFDFNAGSDYPP